MSAAPSGVLQRMSGRPDGLEERAGLPAPSRRTKRFMSSVRAVGASCAKDCALRAVRNFSNDGSSCAHAAASRSRRAAEGASGAGFRADGDGGAVAGLAEVSESGRELDSWPKTTKGALNTSSTAETTTRKYLQIILSVLC